MSTIHGFPFRFATAGPMTRRHRIVVRFYFIRFTYYKYNGRNVLGGARGKDKKAQPNEDDARTADMTAGWRMGSIE